jgi:hypothetical protein
MTAKRAHVQGYANSRSEAYLASKTGSPLSFEFLFSVFPNLTPVSIQPPKTCSYYMPVLSSATLRGVYMLGIFLPFLQLRCRI